MDPIEQLSKLLNELPGIGPRQSKRLAYVLIQKPKNYVQELSRLIEEVQSDVKNCDSCFRYMSKKNLVGGLCSICRSEIRDNDILMVVARDVDLQSLERSGLYKGKYFVLGGTAPVLYQNPEEIIRLRELEDHVRGKTEIKEIILAYSQTPEGEHTARIVEETLGNFSPLHEFKISHLGRGLSTGTELEYSDNETLRNALNNRS